MKSSLSPQTTVADPLDPLIGRVLSGRYRVQRKLGEGGMGNIYLAEHIEMGRPVVLKILQAVHMASPLAVTDFLHEADVVAHLGHENIIDISYGGQTTDGLVFLAMEYLPGTDLGQVLRERGALPWERTRSLLLQITSALAAVHEKGIVHGDIKPDNVFLASQGTSDETVKVLDFGLAKAMGQRDPKRDTVSGTPQYMSPEQTLGHPLDPRSDIYSLGCVIYQMLTGTLPFVAESALDLMAQHNYQAPQPPTERRPDLEISAPLDRLVLRALEKNPSHRFQTMGELHEAIFRVRFGTATRKTGASWDVPPIRVDDSHPRQTARRAQLRKLLFVGAAVAGVGFAGWMYAQIPDRVPVLISADPEDAEIFMDGRMVGQAPLKAMVRPGRFQMWAQAPGYVSKTVSVDIERSQPRHVRLLTTVSDRTTVDVTSDPAGATVFLDGKAWMNPDGTGPVLTPAVLKQLRPGAHTLELRVAARIGSAQVMVDPEVQQKIHVVIPPAATPHRQPSSHDPAL